MIFGACAVVGDDLLIMVWAATAHSTSIAKWGPHIKASMRACRQMLWRGSLDLRLRLAGVFARRKLWRDQGRARRVLMKLGPHLRDKAVWRERSTKSLLCDFIWKWRIPPSVHRSNASSSDFDLEQHAMITSLAARWRLDRTESRWSGIPSITLS